MASPSNVRLIDRRDFDLNWNTGAPEGTGSEIRVAANRVFVDRKRASRVLLPVIHK